MLLQDTLNKYFYHWPTDPKPPGAIRPITDERGNVLAIELQFALAGYKKEDLKIWNEGQTLRIQGANLQYEDVADKFKCVIDRSVAMKETVDLDNAEVSLSEGILRISLPVAEMAKKRKFLLGG